MSERIPFFLKLSQIIVGIIGFTFILYIGQEIILPILFSLIIAILLNPAVNLFTRIGINRIIAISLAVLISLIVIFSLMLFIASQASKLSEALPMLKENLGGLFSDLIQWVSQTFNVSTYKVNQWITDQKTETLSNTSSMIGQTITTVGGVLITLFLVPVYIFMMLYYKPLLLDFVSRIFPDNKHKEVAEVLNQTKFLIQRYLVGLLMEAGLVTLLNSLGLYLLGIDYALLFGVIGAMLNIIPYIGGIIATALPITIALATKEPIYALYVLLLYLTVQLIDNNFIVPKIVASRVKINALISVVVVIIGSAIWGVSGMFLSLPLTAICKVIFDRVENLKPLGFLLGDTMPEIKLFKIRKTRKTQ